MLRHTIFGRPKAKPNTFIGGVAATLTSASQLATKLGITASRIKVFTISGGDIKCHITGSYTIPNNAFSGSADLTYFNDEPGLVTGIGSMAFKNCTALIYVKVKNCVNLGSYCFENAPLTGANNFNSVTNISYLVFLSSKVVAELPLLSVIDSQGFRGIHVDAVVGVPVALKTISSGRPHASLQNYSFLLNATFYYLGYIDNPASQNCEIGAITTVGYTKKDISRRIGITTACFVDFVALVDRVTFNILIPNNSISVNGFIQNVNLTFFYDHGGNFIKISHGAFRDCPNFSSFIFDAVTNIEGNGSGNGCFRNTGIVNANLPSLTSVSGSFTFADNASLKTISSPLLTAFGSAYGMQNCSQLESIYMPLCSALGYTVSSDVMFNGVTKTGGTITVATALSTANAGSPDGDIAFLTSSPRNWTVIYN